MDYYPPPPIEPNQGYTSVAEEFVHEQSVIGAALISDKAADEAIRLLTGKEFSNETYRIIFEAMQELATSTEPIDIVTVTNRLKSQGKLGDDGIVSHMLKMANDTPSAAHVSHYIKIVKEAHIQRQIIMQFSKMSQQAHQFVNPAEIIAAAQERMEELSDQTETQKPFRTIREILPNAFEELEAKSNNGDGEVVGVPSGFADLDRMTTGFQKSDLIIIAARPSVGKTALGLNIASYAARKTKISKEAVAVFSLEMSENQLVSRMICAEGNIDASRFRTGRLRDDDWERVTTVIGHLADLPILIDDTSSINVLDIRAKCRKIKRDHGLGLIIIDYLQLIKGKGTNRQEEVSYITRMLKQIAREFEIPVIALSQLSRGVEHRQDKRPMMSDLRESGSIEQDADIVAFLYRDDYYDKDSEKKNIIEIIIAKQRNGPVGTVELAFLKQFNKFVNLDRSHNDLKKKSSTKPDPWWKVLGVLKSATSAEIEKAYRELAKKYHPDSGGSNELMARINRAIGEARQAK